MNNVKKVKKDDTVKILAGRDRGKTGKVLEVNPKNGKLMVEGVNMVTKHRRPRKSNEKGQKIVKPSFLDVSNTLVVCPNCSQASRVGFVTSKTGEKNRFCKKCNKAF